jgi:hypothetical protein
MSFWASDRRSTRGTVHDGLRLRRLARCGAKRACPFLEKPVGRWAECRTARVRLEKRRDHAIETSGTPNPDPDLITACNDLGLLGGRSRRSGTLDRAPGAVTSRAARPRSLRLPALVARSCQWSKHQPPGRRSTAREQVQILMRAPQPTTQRIHAQEVSRAIHGNAGASCPRSTRSIHLATRTYSPRADGDL